MATYGTNIDISVIGNAIDQLQKIQADYERLKQDPGKEIKVGVDDQASAKLNGIDEKTKKIPTHHDTRMSVSGTQGILSSFSELKSKASETFASIRSDMHKTGESAHRLRDVIAGTAIGQGIYNGISTSLGTMKNGILGAVKAGFEFNSEMDTMNATWTTLTGSAKKADRMTKSIVNLSNTLGQSVDVTDELSQQFYHVFENQPETEKLTKSFLIMGDAIHLSGDRLQQVGMDFTHMLSTSTLHLGELNQITDAFPMFSGKLLEYERKVQHSSKLTMSELRKQISAGKISSKDAEAVMNELGDKYKDASENLMQTFSGMLRQIRANGQVLLGEMAKPLNKAVNPIMKQVSNWVEDERTKKEFEKLGEAAGVGVSAISKAFADAFGDGSISKALDNMVNGLTNAVTQFSQWLARNGTSIIRIFASIGSIAKSVGTGFIDALSDFLHIIPGVHSEGMKGIADAFAEIAKHKTAIEIIGRVWATYFVTSKIMGAAKAMNELYKNMLAITTLSKVQSPTGSLLGDLSGLASNKLSNMRLGAKVGPSGVLAKEAAKDGEKAGSGFLTSFLAKSKGIGRGLAGLLAPSWLLDLGGKLGSKTLAGFARIFGPGISKLISGAGKFSGGLRDIATVISESEFVRKGKIVGSKFAGAFIKTGGVLKNFATRYIIPETWVKAGAKSGTMFRNGFAAASSKIGDTALGQMFSKLSGTRAGAIGEGIAGKLGAGITIGLSAIDLARGLTPSFKGDRIKMIGQGAGGLIGAGIGMYFGGPAGAAVGSMIGNVLGGWIGKAAQKVFNFIRDVFHGRITFSGIEKGFASTMSKVGKWAQDQWKEIKAWWNQDPTEQTRNSSSSKKKSKAPSQKEIKSLGGNHYSKTDIANIKQMNKAVEAYTGTLKRLKQVVKKDDPTKQLRGMSNQFKKLNPTVERSAKYWKQLAKPIETSAKSFAILRKALKDFDGKRNPLDKLESSVKSLTKTVQHYKFGKELAKQMVEADKSMSGKHSFVGRFNTMTRQVETDLRKFKVSFDRDWKDTWQNIDRYPSRALNSVRTTVSSRLNSVESKEHSFVSSFLSAWRKWNSDVVSQMRSAFDKLPGIAQKAMSGIVDRLNRGISSINGVISDFGGDKKLSAVHYANGTTFRSAHPGGLAVINDGAGQHKQELVWQPSQGWKLFSGLNRMVTLEPGAQVIPGGASHHVLSALGVPHYAGGTISEDEQDKIAEEFINNPVKASRDLVLKFTNWQSSVPIVPSFGKATAIGFSRGIANVLKDLLGIIKEPINGDWTPVIKSAARLLHFHISDGQVAKLLRQIQTESGGKEVITNNWDSNAKAGHPSQGLLQFIPSTFNTWAVGKYRNINKGFDQILAAINALNHGGEGGWGNIGNGHGWANGGHILQPSYSLVGEDGDEYIINPNKPNAMELASEALHDIIKRNPNISAARPTRVNAQYRPAVMPTVQTTNNSNPIVSLVRQAVEKLDNIDMHPYVHVEDIAKPVNKYNAKNFARQRR